MALITTDEFFFKDFRKSSACFKVVFCLVPAITGIPKLRASSFAEVLSPNIFKVLSLGPTNLIFARLAAEAKEEFSLKKPYPG